MKDDSFFLPGACKDPAYRNVRDNPRYKPDWAEETAFDFTESLWPRYCDLADPHFRQDAMNHFLARFWEMYLAVTLRERGFKLMKVGKKGPEFYFLHNNHKVWVEAVAPGPGEKGENRVPGYRYDELADVPEEKILLRFTHALVTKRDKYREDTKKGIITPDDFYILAINSRGIPHAPFGGDFVPLFVKAFLPLETPEVRMDTGRIVETLYQRREHIEKANKEPVPTTAFLNPGFSFISAVLHSAVDCVNHPAILGDDFSILHNHAALPSHRLDPSVFQWCEQIFYQDGILERRPAKEEFKK